MVVTKGIPMEYKKAQSMESLKADMLTELSLDVGMVYCLDTALI